MVAQGGRGGNAHPACFLTAWTRTPSPPSAPALPS